MPRMSSKTNKNLYFKKREELGLTREKAAELLESIPADRIEKIENERVVLHPEEAMIMAEKYVSPEICNYYCSHDCCIGRHYVPEIKQKELSQIIIEMISSLNVVNRKQERLIDITVDGTISDDEIKDFKTIQKELDKLSLNVKTLQLWSEKMLAEGYINRIKYEEL